MQITTKARLVPRLPGVYVYVGTFVFMSQYVDPLLISYRKPYLSKGKNYDDFCPIFQMRQVKFGLKLIRAMGPIWLAYRLTLQTHL